MTDTLAPTYTAASSKSADYSTATKDEMSRVKDIKATDIAEKWRVADKALREDRRNFWYNLAFYQGHQWLWWNRDRNQVSQLDPRASDDERVRVTVNKIASRLDGLMGRLTKRALTFEVQASAADDATLTGARLAEIILEAARQDQHWEDVRTTNLQNKFFGATSAILIEWDPDASPTDTITLQPNLEAEAGDIRLTPLSITEFTLQPGSKRPEDAQWAIVACALPPEQVKDRYNLPEIPQSDASNDLSPFQRQMLASRGWEEKPELTTVLTYYQRPNTKRQEPGRVCTVVNQSIVAEEDWPYPFDRLPLVIFRQRQITMRWNGDTLLNDARKIQAPYNQIRSSILEHAKKAGNARMMVPFGSIPDIGAMSDEPGEMIEYYPEGGNKPEWMSPPQLGRWLTQEADRLEMELDDIMFTHAVSRGQAPGDRNSGLALSVLAEKDDTPLSITARDEQNGWSLCASLVLTMYAHKVTNSRTASMSLDPSLPPMNIPWSGEMLQGQTRATMPLDAAMPHSRVAMQQFIINLKQTFPEQFQGLDINAFLRLMEVPGASFLRDVMDDDVARAVDENHMMMMGEIALPRPWHDHAIHIAEHNRERNSRAFTFVDPEIEWVFAQHLQAHEMILAEEVARTSQLNAIMPGAAGFPSADRPVGAAVPPDHIDASRALPPAPVPATSRMM